MRVLRSQRDKALQTDWRYSSTREESGNNLCIGSGLCTELRIEGMLEIDVMDTSSNFTLLWGSETKQLGPITEQSDTVSVKGYTWKKDAQN